jgi:hypothetical protein
MKSVNKIWTVSKISSGFPAIVAGIVAPSIGQDTGVGFGICSCPVCVRPHI